MRNRALQALSVSLVGILLAIVLFGYIFSEQIMIGAMNQLDLTTFKVRGKNMFLAGEINTKTPKTIKKAILDNPQVTTLVLTQMPGSLDDEALFPFAEWVRRRGLNTHLRSTSEIASGAVDLFLAGKDRTMEKGARIGVHSWGDGNKQASDYPLQHGNHQMNADYITRMLGSDGFYWFTIYAAPADSVHWMNEVEIDKFELLTAPPLTK